MKTGTELRREALREVEDCVCRDRQATHGPAESNFAVIAEFWTTHLRTRGLIAPRARVESFDVAAMSGLIKSARAAHNPRHRDNWVDLAGYAVCGAGIIARDAEQAVAAANAVIGDEERLAAAFGGPSPEETVREIRPAEPAGSPIAPGHNPDRLTEAQVGVAEGWRLLAPEEVRDRRCEPDIGMWSTNGERWMVGGSGSSAVVTYRTKQPPGYFLPKPQSYAEALNAAVAP